jgi:heterodisulfide reductase subunit A-like polyferredoxin
MNPKVCIMISDCGACSGMSKADTEKVVSLLSEESTGPVVMIKSLCGEEATKSLQDVRVGGCNRAVIGQWCPAERIGNVPRLPKQIDPGLIEIVDLSLTSDKSGKGNVDRTVGALAQAAARLSLAEPLRERKINFASKSVTVIGSSGRAVAAAKLLASHGLKTKIIMPQTHSMKAEHLEVLDESNVQCLSGTPGNFKICLSRKGKESETDAAAVLLVGERCFANVNPPKDSKIKVVPLEQFAEHPSGKVGGMVFIDDLNAFNSDADPVVPAWHTLLESAKIAARDKLADNIAVVARDVKAAGLLELVWKEAAEAGVKFIRYDDKTRPKIEKGENLISVKDLVLGETLFLPADILVAPITTRPWEPVFIEKLFVPSDWDFKARSRGPQRGVDQSSCDGVFLVGYSNFAKLTDEVEPELSSTVAQIVAMMRQGYHIAKAAVAEITEGKCSGCFTCVRTCPYRAAEMNDSWKAEIIADKCQGCGNCVAVCPSKAIELKNCTRPQIAKEVAASLEVVM